MKSKIKDKRVEFERRHWGSVKNHHEEMVKLPYEKKLEIVEGLQADCSVIRKSVFSLTLSKT